MLNKGEIITIAGGHVGHAGARGCGFKEEELAYEISKTLATMFNKNGYKAYEVSPEGTGYTENSQLRAEVANANKYTDSKLHLCIHFNAFNSSANGTETWIYAQGGNAEKFAIKINAELVDLGFVNRGVKVSGNNLYVPRMTTAPCCLVEVCFIDSQSDMSKYNLNKTCNAIYKAVTGVAYSEFATNETGDSIVTDSGDIQNSNSSSSLGVVQGYNATIINDWFYTRDGNGNKDGGRIDIGDKVKVLDVSYSKQLTYVEYPVDGGTKKAYIANATNCIDYIYQDQWVNGSTSEDVYETSLKVNKIGNLSPREKATPLYRENGLLHVVYNTAKGEKTKSGFVVYDGGFNKL